MSRCPVCTKEKRVTTQAVKTKPFTKSVKKNSEKFNETEPSLKPELPKQNENWKWDKIIGTIWNKTVTAPL